MLNDSMCSVSQIQCINVQICSVWMVYATSAFDLTKHAFVCSNHRKIQIGQLRDVVSSLVSIVPSKCTFSG